MSRSDLRILAFLDDPSISVIRSVITLSWTVIFSTISIFISSSFALPDAFISINLIYFSVAFFVKLLKSAIVGNIGNSGSNGYSKNRWISVSSLAMEAMGGTIGIEHVGGDDVFGKRGRMALTVLADDSYFCFFTFLSLLLLWLISSRSAEEATSDWVTCDVVDVNSIRVGSS